MLMHLRVSIIIIIIIVHLDSDRKNLTSLPDIFSFRDALQ